MALCLREGNNLHVVEEHMTPQAAIQMYKDVMTGKISVDDITAREWRTVDIREAGFKGATRAELPPIDQWPE